jgi:hypothetical protein
MGCVPWPKAWRFHQSVSALSLRPSIFRHLMQFPSTELECSIKGYSDAVFQSCASHAEGNIRFRLFVQRVGQMFAGPDPFSKVTGMIPSPDRTGSTSQPVTPIPVTEPLLAPQDTEPSEVASKRVLSSSSHAPPPPRFKLSRPGDGWYVAHNAVLPGVYYGT